MPAVVGDVRYTLPIMGRATPANLYMLGQSSIESIVRPAIAEENISDMSGDPIIGSVDGDDEHPLRRPKPSRMESIVQPAIPERNTSDTSGEPIIGFVDDDAEHPSRLSKPSSMESIVQPVIPEGNTSDTSGEPIIDFVDSDAERPPRGPKSSVASAEEQVEQRLELWRYKSNLVFKPGETVVSRDLLERT